MIQPDEAFAILGNDTRMKILQTLGTANSPVPFTELHNRVDVRDSGRFNYHLDKLVGHFVDQTDDGYELKIAGERVIDAVLSGAISHSPTVEPTELDERCYHCETPIWIDYKDQVAYIYCRGCSGNFDISEDVLRDRFEDAERAAKFSVKSSNVFPPALVKGRSAAQIHRAAGTRFHLDMFSWGLDLCPRCSAPLDPSVEVCEEHEVSEELCSECSNLQATMLVTTCTNCTYSKDGLFSYRLFSHTAMLDFITDHDLNPIAPDSLESFWGHFTPYEEEILSVDPFEARFKFTIEGDAITFTINDELTVIDATRHRESDRT